MIRFQGEEELFHTALVKYGVNYHKAAQVAKIIASKRPDELLTPEEVQLTKEACSEWLRQHQRLSLILENTNDKGRI